MTWLKAGKCPDQTMQLCYIIQFKSTSLVIYLLLISYATINQMNATSYLLTSVIP